MAAGAEGGHGESGFGELRELLGSERLDALIVTDLQNIRRLCGFTGTNAVLGLFEGEAVFVTDSRYTLQAKDQVKGARVVTAADCDKQIAAEAVAHFAGYVGLEAGGVTAKRWRRFSGLMPGAELVDLGALLTRVRLKKTPQELQRLRQASKLSEEAFRAAAALVKEGSTEVEVAREFHIQALRLGARGLSFDTIVAGGPRGALPHAMPGERKFQPGDLVVFDFGIKLDGYCSDQTVTLAVGEISQEAEKVYGVVLQAQKAALKAVKPGVKMSQIDAAAREIIKGAGYGEYFGHGTGHGVGLDVHEAPSVGPRSEEVAEEAMVITIEPGIYLPGKFGIRLEETVAVTGEGFERITSLSKELADCRV